MHSGVSVNFEFASDEEINDAISELRHEQQRRKDDAIRHEFAADGCKKAIEYLADLLTNDAAFDDTKLYAVQDVLDEALPTCQKLVHRAVTAAADHTNTIDDYYYDRGVGYSELERSYGRALSAIAAVKKKLTQKAAKK